MNAPDMLVECGGRRTLEGVGSLLPLCGFLRSNSIMAARTFTRGDLFFFFIFKFCISLSSKVLSHLLVRPL